MNYQKYQVIIFLIVNNFIAVDKYMTSYPEISIQGYNKYQFISVRIRR